MRFEVSAIGKEIQVLQKQLAKEYVPITEPAYGMQILLRSVMR